MGVTGLWKLIDASGKPVPLETLENKVLAIDISIWLHQVVKGFQDNKGSAIAHAHLLGLFNRLCKLLYYRIKPVFVFDGGVPYLKKQTIAKRSQGRNKLINEAERLQQLLLESLAKEKVVKQALGVNAELLLKSPSKPKPAKKSKEEELFKLPELPSSQDIINSSQSSTGNDATSDTDSSFEGNSLRHSYLQNLHSIDVTSTYFKNLPADVRHEILTDIKEIRKQSSWGKLHELPAQSDDFSLFQMKRLLKRRQVQVSLEEAEKQMEGKSLTLNELQTFLTEEGVVNTAKANATKQIASDENTRFLLVRDLKKAIEKAAKKEKENPLEDGESSEEKCVKMEKLGKEYDEELETAIKMSLEATAVYDDDDYDCDNVKMSKEQREKLRSAAMSLARAYMIEYGGMNDDEVKDLFSTPQNAEEEDDIMDSFCFNHNDKFIVKGDMCTPYKHIEDKLVKENEKPKDEVLVENKQIKIDETKTDSEEIGIISSDSDSDSDFIEVTEVVNDMNINNKKESEQKLEIFVDLTKLDKDEEDIFADVFDNDSNKPITLSDGSAAAAEIGSKMSTQERTLEEEKTDRKEESDEDILKESLIVEEDELEKEDSVNVGDKMVEDSSAGGDGEKNIIDEDKMKVELAEDDKDAKSSLKVISTNLKDILNKLKEDLNEIPKISLDDIVLDNFNAKEQDRNDIKMHKILKEGDTTEQTQQFQEDNVEAVIIRKDDIKANTVKAHDILNKLKQDLESVSKITLDDIRLNSSDDVKTQKLSTEVIEIVENDDLLLNTAKTPSKAKIDNYFEKQFVVKRTPEKSIDDEKETTPKVQSPFFVNKSPSSSTKKRNQLLNGEDEPPQKRDKIVSKMLFEKSSESESNQELGVNPIDSSENALEIAAKILKENKSREELEDLADDLAKEKRDLEAERNKQNRMGASITDKMSTDCMHLLQLFGVPYIIAPMEAEAQCAFLDAINLTDGTITDDSDIWLFGGQTVYKNFFNQKKHVMEFRIENIEKLYSIDRKKLIQLAILVGSDYTTGINGVGAVTALEILATFPTTAPKDGEVSNTMSVLSSLRRFREWFRSGTRVGVGGKTALRSKLKNIEMAEGFPNIAVVEAYLSPKVDDSRDKFKWGTPDAETIREFTKKTFGWTRMKTDEILLPVLKRMNEKKVQASIKNYFAVKSSTAVHELKVSKRVQKAINKISGGVEEDDEPIVKKKRSKIVGKKNLDAEQNDGIKQKSKGKRTRKQQKQVTEGEQPSTSSAVVEKEFEDIPNKVSKKNVNIPNTKQVIPQKEKDLKDMQKKKELAAELFKKSQGNEKQKKKKG